MSHSQQQHETVAERHRTATDRSRATLPDSAPTAHRHGQYRPIATRRKAKARKTEAAVLADLRRGRSRRSVPTPCPSRCRRLARRASACRPSRRRQQPTRTGQGVARQRPDARGVRTMVQAFGSGHAWVLDPMTTRNASIGVLTSRRHEPARSKRESLAHHTPSDASIRCCFPIGTATVMKASPGLHSPDSRPATPPHPYPPPHFPIAHSRTQKPLMPSKVMENDASRAFRPEASTEKTVGVCCHGFSAKRVRDGP